MNYKQRAQIMDIILSEEGAEINKRKGFIITCMVYVKEKLIEENWNANQITFADNRSSSSH
jgi:hypothetical protein